MSIPIFGNPNSIIENTIYNSRIELIEAGLHRSTVRGIDGNAAYGAAAIVLSGGYEDDYDLGDQILYTGEGGNDPSSGKQVAHQSWNSPGNAGLLFSEQNDLPVRVIRGSKHKSNFSPKDGYKYGGLYFVTNSEKVIGKSGFKICRFTLNKINTTSLAPLIIQSGNLVLLKSDKIKEKWYSIDVDAPIAQKLNSASKMGQLLFGKKIGEKIDFGPGFEIIEIKKYLSK